MSASSTSNSTDAAVSPTYDDSTEITTRPVDPDTRAKALADYAALKDRISGRGRRFGAGLALYLLLTLSGEAALACLVGAAASALYLLWLFRDADALSEDSTVPVMAARQVEGAIPRGVAMTLAGLATGLSPRLLVPISLGAGAWAVGKVTGEPLPLAVDGGLVLGFLSHKAGLILEVWDELKPKVDPDAGLKKERPRLDLPEVEDWRVVFEREKKEKEEREREDQEKKRGFFFFVFFFSFFCNLSFFFFPPSDGDSSKRRCFLLSQYRVHVSFFTFFAHMKERRRHGTGTRPPS